MLFDLQVACYTPIIVHPERNREIMEHPSILYDFVRRGVLTQVTAGSICGHFGKKMQKFSHQVIEADLTHFIASDAHNTTTRGFCLQEAYDVVHKDHGDATNYMLMENCALLIDGKHVIREEPTPIKRKKILGFL